jgi:predicted nucleic acid-binding Zn finger protein
MPGTEEDSTKYKKTCEKDFWDRVISIYGRKGENALTAVRENRVLKYLDFFVVIGNSGEYVVEDDFCTCHDFAFRQKECWHILAVRIAKYTKEYTEINEWYQDKWVK